MRITFRQQVTAGILLLGLAFLLAHILQNGIYINIAWILYGAAFLIHPVWPRTWHNADPRKMKRGARIGGALCILIGLLTRFGV